MEVKHLFSDFMVEEKLDIDHDAISDYIYKQKETAQGESIYFNGTEDVMKPFFTEAQKRIDVLHTKLGLTYKLKHKIYQAWANINSNEHITSPHSHMERPYAIISGVYYPKAKKGCMPIEFLNNNSAVESVFYYDVIEQWTEFNRSVASIHPETGTMILFPSWLKHYVALTGESDDDRISLAFNAEMVPD